MGGEMPRFFSLVFFALFLAMVPAFSKTASAGPPFLTDDPEPVDFKHWEAYLFSTISDRARQTDAVGPAAEFNVGALPNLQLHLVIPLAYAAPQGASRAYGFGDIEFGMKFRFVQETKGRPMVGVFPMIEIPTGDSGRGLGNGRAWWRLPLWVQKSWGPWTTYGGGGYAFNPSPGQRNYPFGGWQVQRELGEKLTLGGEIFAQGKSASDFPASAVFNLGGYFKITEKFQILFTGGHSFAGARNTVGYLGLYWTGGFGKKKNNHKEPEEPK
jgi:hypothetical protein